MQVKWFDLSNNFIVDIPKNIFSYYPKLQVLNLSRNRLIAISSEELWRMMYSLEILQMEGNQFPCNCPGLELKETLTSLIVRDIIKNVIHIKCVVPLEMKDKVIYNLPDSKFGCSFINWVLILSLLHYLSYFLFLLLFLLPMFSDIISHCFYLYILDGYFFIIIQRMKHSMMYLYHILPRTVIG